MTADAMSALMRDARVERGWTQARLAGEARVTREWVSRFETGQPGAELHRVLRAFDALGLEIDVAREAGRWSQP
jgi:transcriptional regulator with XRE-family HTH domain